MSHDNDTLNFELRNASSASSYGECSYDSAGKHLFSLSNALQDVVENQTQDLQVTQASPSNTNPVVSDEGFGLSSSNSSIADAMQPLTPAFIYPSETTSAQSAILPLLSLSFPYLQVDAERLPSGLLPQEISSFRLPEHENPSLNAQSYPLAQSALECPLELPSKRRRPTVEPVPSSFGPGPVVSEFPLTSPAFSPSLPPPRMSRSERIQHALDVLRAGRISPFDLLSELVDVSSTTRTAHYRSKLYSQKNQKLEKLLDLIVEDPCGKSKVEDWVHLRRIGQMAERAAENDSSKENAPPALQYPIQQKYYRPY